MWESNPPRRGLAASTGFEDQGAHQNPYIPEITLHRTERVLRVFPHDYTLNHDKVKALKAEGAASKGLKS